MTVKWYRTLSLAALIVAAAVPASAQMPAGGSWYVAPSLSLNAGGVTTSSSPAVGVSGGWMSSSRLGLEGEIAWTPDFFEQNGFRIARRMRTVMGGVTWRLRSNDAAIVPYVAGGAGLISPELSDAGDLFRVDERRAGFNVGGGAAWFHRQIGVRGDVRYVRTIDEGTPNALGVDLSTIDFWRVSTGLVVRF
jgi:hypothetical protein